MLYDRCNGQMFYAGQEGLESRHETRTDRLLDDPSTDAALCWASYCAPVPNRADDPYGLTVVTD